MDEQSLVTGLRKGNPQAQAQLVQTYGEPLVRFLISVCRADQMDAEDIAIEAMYRAIQRIDSFRARNEEKKDFRNWLFTIARNLCRDRARKQPPMTRIDNWDQVNDHSREEDDYSESDLVIQVREALRQLPENQRLTLQMHYNGLKLTEVAQVLGVTSGQVRQWKRRWLSALSELIGDVEK